MGAGAGVGGDDRLTLIFAHFKSELGLLVLPTFSKKALFVSSFTYMVILFMKNTKKRKRQKTKEICIFIKNQLDTMLKLN